MNICGHIYVTGFNDDGNFPGCPCAAVPGPDSPAFVGNHYYCEAGYTREDFSTAFYTSDLLWDGHAWMSSMNNA